MEKYRKEAEKKLTTKTHPDTIAKEALVKAEFSSRERNEFFDGVYGEILTDYFISWLGTEPHEVKTREFIYNSALALGDVKSRLIQYETFGRNIKTMEEDTNGTLDQ